MPDKDARFGERGLPPRKRQVLSMLAIGKKPAEIASELHLSRDTVYQHIEACRKRLRAKTTYELIRLATRKGFVE